MERIHILGTGGTIVSRKADDGSTVAADSIAQLLAATGLDVEVSHQDVININSFRIRFRDQRVLAEAVDAVCADPDVAGVVITHGTDTMEETAFLLDLVHRHDQPVFLTGAQRAADMPNTDGPENLRQAVLAASDPRLRGTGVGISFESEIHAARHTRKLHTLSPGPFAGGTHVASVLGEEVLVRDLPRRLDPLPLPTAAFDSTKIHIIDGSPETGTELFDAALAAGADGIVLVGVGSGNAPEGFVEVVRQATDAGTPVVLATRVPSGPVAPIYGNGGGVDLVAAGAIEAGLLNPYQAKVLLALLVSQRQGIASSENSLAAMFQKYSRQ